MKKKPYQVKTVIFNGDDVKTKIVGCDSLEEASLIYVKIVKRGGYDRVHLSVNGLTLAGQTK